MKLDEMITASKKKNAKFENVDITAFLDGQVYSAMNMVATKEGTGYAGSFANWCMDMGKLGGFDLLECRELGNLMQRLALDSKHDGNGSYKETLWYVVCTLKNRRFATDAAITAALEMALNGVSLNSVNYELCDFLD